MSTKVILVSHNHFLNSALKKIITDEMQLACALWGPQRLQSLQDMDLDHRQASNVLLMVDYAGFDLDDVSNSIWLYLKEGSYPTRIAALFNVPRDTGIENQFLDLGVRGIFYDDYELDLFRKGVYILLDGDLWFSRDVLCQYIQKQPLKKPEDPPINSKDLYQLTPREEEILIMVSLGKSNAQIAEELFISPSTVKTHIYNIFQKIKVPNRIQAALWTAKHLSRKEELRSR